MLNAYNRIAWVYDFLAQLVYGNNIINSQTYFLNEIPANSQVLIIGGGSGKILTHLLNVQPMVKVDFVEASSEMLHLAKKKVKNDPRIHFIHGTHKNITQHYDVIITAFFLDLFMKEELLNVIKKLKQHHKENGLWIVSDFYPSKKPFHKTLYFLTHTFFKLTTDLKVNELFLFEQFVNDDRYVTRKRKQWYNGFIRSYVLDNT